MGPTRVSDLTQSRSPTTRCPPNRRVAFEALADARSALLNKRVLDDAVMNQARSTMSTSTPSRDGLRRSSRPPVRWTATG